MKTLFAILISLCLAGTALAANEQIVMPTESGLYVLAAERLSVLGTGTTNFTSLSTANIEKFKEAHIFNTDGDSVRFRVDGTSPTTTVGFPLAADAGLVIKDVRSFNKFQAITDSSGSGSSLFMTVYGK